MKYLTFVRVRAAAAFKAAVFALKGYEIFAADRSGAQRIFKITDRGVIRQKVAGAIEKQLHPDSIFGEVSKQEMIDEIVAEIYGEEHRPALKQLSEMHERNLAFAYTRLVVASGMTTLWETDIRIFARRMGLSVVVPTEEKKRRNANIVAPHFKKTEDLYKELLEKAPCLKMNIRRHLDLRGALVHGNIRELRQVYLQGKPKSEHASSRGKVVELDLSTNEIFDLADKHDNAFIDSRDVFGLFLEGASSELFENVTEEILAAMSDLKSLIEFSAHSELVGVMRAMMNGKVLSAGEQAEVAKVLVSYFHSQESAAALIERLTELSSKRNPKDS